VEAGLRCGVCEPCKRQLPFCLNGGIFGFSTPLGTLQGGQAEFVRVPFAQRIMHPIADHLTDEDVILLTDNMLTGYTAAEWGSIQPGDTVVVYGCGVVGLCAQVTAQLFGPGRVFAVDRLPYRLEMAKRVGSIPIDASSEDPPTRIRQETGLLGAPVVIEAVGARATLEMAFQSVRPQGIVSVVGVFTEDATIPMSVLTPGVTVRTGLASSLCLPRLLTMVESGGLDMKFVFSHTLPLSEGARAYRLFDKKEEQALKVLLKPRNASDTATKQQKQGEALLPCSLFSVPRSRWTAQNPGTWRRPAADLFGPLPSACQATTSTAMSTQTSQPLA
jgi:threonine dehydrogenase-like Zn-dependent dehydrogenase